MSTSVTYLFDPLCGWCYGASPAMQKLELQTAITLKLAPTGLFAGSGRTMDAAFANYAWSNDLRIAKLTGQRFTETYRTQILGKLGDRFDSGVTTLALTAVARTTPLRELEALQVLQEARYIHGLDTSVDTVVAEVLRGADLNLAADLLISQDHELLTANELRVKRAQELMRMHGAEGVPGLIITNANGARYLRGDALFGKFDDLLNQISAE